MITLAVSPISAYSNIYAGYNVLSVNGNPKSLQAIEPIDLESKRSKPLVNVSQEREEQVPTVAVGMYADMIKAQEYILSSSNGFIDSSKDDATQNNLKDIANSMMVGIRTEIPTTELLSSDLEEMIEESMLDSMQDVLQEELMFQN